MSPQDRGDIAVELERLHGLMKEGFAHLNGRMDVIAQRFVHTDRQIGDVEQALAEHENRLDALEKGETAKQTRVIERLDALEARRWPMASVNVLVSVGMLVVGALGAVVAFLELGN